MPNASGMSAKIAANLPKSGRRLQVEKTHELRRDSAMLCVRPDVSRGKSSDATHFRLIVLMCDFKMPLNFSTTQKFRRDVPFQEGYRLSRIAANPALSEQGFCQRFSSKMISHWRCLADTKTGTDTK